MIGLLLLLVSIGLVAGVAVRERSLPLGVLALSMGVFYGLRALGLVFGWDQPYPDYLFLDTDLLGTLDRFGLMVLLFTVCALFAHAYAAAPAEALSRILPLPRRPIPGSTLVAAVVVVTCFAGAIAAYQGLAHGGLGGILYAAKSSREGGQGMLRIPATVALGLSCGAFYATRPKGGSIKVGGPIRLILFACAVASAAAASVWGSRQFAVVAAAYLLGGPAITAFRESKRSWWFRAGVVITVVVAVGFGLRLYRDAQLGGQTAVSQAQNNEFRRISISVNGSTLDSSLLAARDWPSMQPWRHGGDFVDGLWGSVPASWRPASVPADTFGAEFHQIYEPNTKNGWPIGAVTEWFVNFGWIGVGVGGLLSGAIYRAISVGLRRSPAQEIAAVSTLILTIIVFPLGLDAASANRFVVHAVPLAVVLTFLQRHAERTTPSRGAAALGHRASQV